MVIIRHHRCGWMCYSVFFAMLWGGAAAQETKDAVELVAEKKQTDEEKLQKRIAETVMDDFRDTAQSYLVTQIQELKQECKLEPVSVKKLEIAAKGASDRFVANYREQLNDRLIRHPAPETGEIKVGARVVRAGIDPNGKFFAKLRKLVQGRAEQPDYYHIFVALRSESISLRIQERHRGSNYGLGSSGGLNQLMKQPLWIKALDTVVTKQQKLQYQEATQRRLDRLRRATVTFQISRLDSELRLTEKQRTDLTMVLKDHLDLSKVNPDSLEWRTRRQIKDIDLEKISSLITPPQLQIWRAVTAQW